MIELVANSAGKPKKKEHIIWQPTMLADQQ